MDIEEPLTHRMSSPGQQRQPETETSQWQQRQPEMEVTLRGRQVKAPKARRMSFHQPGVTHRLLRRGSNPRFTVAASAGRRHGRKIMVFMHDYFHSLIQIPWWALLSIASVGYILSWLFFAVFYYALDSRCGLSAETFLGALYFSLITGSTIGYGTNTLKFEGCVAALFVISAQTLFTTFSNAVLLGLLYAKFSRGSTRANRILFSNKAVVRKIGSSYCFSFQVVDGSFGTYLDDPLIEAHVRVFAVRDAFGDDGDGVIPFQQCVMRLSQPNDELGGMLMLSLPSAVIHRIDAWSPLLPPHSEEANNKDCSLPEARQLVYPAPLMRSVDAECGNRAAYPCEICGESYENLELLRKHQVAAAVSDRISGHDARTLNAVTGEVFGSGAALSLNTTYIDEELHASGRPKLKHRCASMSKLLLDQQAHSHCNHLKYLPEDVEEEEEGEEDDSFRVKKPTLPLEEEITSSDLQIFFQTTKLEIIVFVEAIDLSTSNTIQARNSYSFLDGDIELDAAHVTPCTSRSPHGGCVINLERFHAVYGVGHVSHTRSTPSIV